MQFCASSGAWPWALAMATDSPEPLLINKRNLVANLERKCWRERLDDIPRILLPS